ncbi:MAG: TRAP transporter large permease [Rhodospirillales bacterium]|jgi:tripartite ATP-independent transporter DctM subunit|nr:TRAP transporter large permease [Rhodospirillales bacterium]
MSWEILLLVYALMLAVLLLGGTPIGAALGLTGLVGVTLVGGTRLWPTLGDVLWNNSNSFTLVAVPLFVLMGEIILRTGVSRRFYRSISMALAPLPGGLAHANIAGCAVFAAFSGSSVATALTMGTVAIPEMEARGYDHGLTAGSLAAGGSLGILIPPSIPMIVYSAMVNESVIDIFIAGIIPGILLATIFSAYIAIRVGFSRHLAPADRSIRLGLRVIMQAVGDCWAVVLLIATIIGGMYFGLVTPTEAAGFGCLVAVVIGFAYREMTWAGLVEAFRNSITTTCVVMFIIINGMILSFAIVDAGISRGISRLIVESELSGWQFFAILFVLYLILGMFVEGITMMLLTVPVIYTSITALGFDGVWFGVILVVFIELAALTPPMGLNLFAIQSVSGGWPLIEVIKGSAPFSVIISIFAFLLFLFPDIALWLPRTMHALQ